MEDDVLEKAKTLLDLMLCFSKANEKCSVYFQGKRTA